MSLVCACVSLRAVRACLRACVCVRLCVRTLQHSVNVLNPLLYPLLTRNMRLLGIVKVVRTLYLLAVAPHVTQSGLAMRPTTPL